MKVSNEPISISDILKDKIFTVPLYQREYSWTLDQVSDLYYDILGAEGESHFLGSLLLYKNQDYSKKTEIVDGQQRVTTLLFATGYFEELQGPGKPKQLLVYKSYFLSLIQMIFQMNFIRQSLD